MYYAMRISAAVYQQCVTVGSNPADGRKKQLSAKNLTLTLLG